MCVTLFKGIKYEIEILCFLDSPEINDGYKDEEVLIHGIA